MIDSTPESLWYVSILQVAVVNDPRAHNPYDFLYTVEYLGNMTDSPLVLYINQSADTLKQLALASIKNNEVTTTLMAAHAVVFCTFVVCVSLCVSISVCVSVAL